MVEQSVSPSGQYDPDDPNPDRYDLISQELEQHIAAHPDGDACLQLLYKLYDQWTGHLLDQTHTKTQHARLGVEKHEPRRQAALDWYLAEGKKLLKKKAYRSYNELSIKLHMNAGSDPKGRRHLRSSSRIADRLRAAARTWYLTKAEQIVKEDPHISGDALVDTLKGMAREESRVFSLSRKGDIKRYLRAPLELWRLIALSGTPDGPLLTDRIP